MYPGEGPNLRSKQVELPRPTGLELYPFCYEWNNTDNYEGGYEMPHTPYDEDDPAAEPLTDSQTALKPSIISIINSKKEQWDMREGPNDAVTFYDSRVRVNSSQCFLASEFHAIRPNFSAPVDLHTPPDRAKVDLDDRPA